MADTMTEGEQEAWIIILKYNFPTWKDNPGISFYILTPTHVDPLKLMWMWVLNLFSPRGSDHNWQCMKKMITYFFYTASIHFPFLKYIFNISQPSFNHFVLMVDSWFSCSFFPPISFKYPDDNGSRLKILISLMVSQAMFSSMPCVSSSLC